MKNSLLKVVTIISLFFLLFFTQTISADDTVLLEYYYHVSTSCGSCVAKNEIIDEIELNYTDTVTIIRIDVDNTSNYQEGRARGITTYPGCIINGETVFQKYNITKENLETVLNDYIAELEKNKDQGVLSTENLLPIVLLVSIVVVFAVLITYSWKKEKKK